LTFARRRSLLRSGFAGEGRMEKDSRPKRYFWRRLVAFAIDFVLAYAAAVIILTAVDAVTGGRFYYWDGFIARTACAEVPSSALLDEINLTHPVAPGWNRASAVCLRLPVGGKAQYVLSVNDWTSDGRASRTASIAMPVTATADQLDRGLRLDPTAFLAYAIMLAWAWRFGRSPGKRWLGLVVQPVAAAAGADARRLRREWLRLGPLALFSLGELVIALVGWWFLDSVAGYLRLLRFIGDDLIPLIVVSFALVLPALVYYVFPFVRWRGQTFYDQLAGTMVTRGIETPKAP
jgi:hypothetical protein